MTRSTRLNDYQGRRDVKYDAGYALYNVNSDSFARFRAAIAKARNGGGSAVVACVGDSTTVGLGGATPYIDNNYPSRLRALLIQSGKFATISDGRNSPNTTFDERMVFTGWQGSSGFGLAGNNGTAAAGPAVSVATSGTFTSKQPCDSIEMVIVTAGNAGAFTYQVDGGSAVTVTPPTTNGTLKVSITGLSRAVHSLTINPPVAASTLVSIMSIEPIDSQATLRISHFGAPGISSNTICGVRPGDTQLLGALEAMYDAPTTPPALAIVNIGTGDRNTVPPTPLDVYEGNLRRLVAKARTKNGDVLLMGLHAIGTTANGNQAAFTQALYNVADDTNCGLIDLTRRWGPNFLNTEPYAYMGDSLHPNSRGYWDWAQAAASAVLSLV